MTANKPMTGEQLDELMTVAVNMQRDSEKAGDRPTSMFAYAVQVAVLELRNVREMKPTYEELEQQLAESHRALRAETTAHENTQMQLEKMAAENAGLKSFGDKLDEMHNDLNGEGTGIQGRAEVACQQVALEAAMEEFDAIKTPATDTFLAEVRAQGVEMFASKCKEESKRAHSSDARDSWWVSGENADDFADQIRKGVQS